MRNIKLTIEYDGTNYCGWQVQKNCVSIQETLEKAIILLTNETICLTGSSRTDAGVHARGMVANFFTASRIPINKFPLAINGKLPKDITIVGAEEVDESFHSRYSCIGKRYSYTILNRKYPSSILRNYAAHISMEMNINKMKEACNPFLGTHDFSAFRSTGSSVKSSVRTVKHINIDKQKDIIKLEIEADGFLYNMVRIIAGTLIDVGIGKIAPERVPEIIESCKREKAGKTAPAQGLCLECVYY